MLDVRHLSFLYRESLAILVALFAFSMRIACFIDGISSNSFFCGTVVREMKGPFSDPQHPYMYEEEDMWMAPGFINQFYPVCLSELIPFALN